MRLGYTLIPKHWTARIGGLFICIDYQSPVIGFLFRFEIRYIEEKRKNCFEDHVRR